MAHDSPLLERIKAAGYHIEPCAVSPESTSIVEFPVDAGEGVRTAKDVSMWEQLSLAAFLQRHWADNQVLVVRCAVEVRGGAPCRVLCGNVRAAGVPRTVSMVTVPPSPVWGHVFVWDFLTWRSTMGFGHFF